MLWKFSLAIFISFMVSACALFEERRGPETFVGPREQVFYATFEEVWRATNLVMQPYPLRVSNMDQGLLESDVIRGYKVFVPVYKSPTAVSAETYRILIRIVKGSLEGKAATKVVLSRDTQMQSDFFSDPKTVHSDGLEEKVILYRISREIQIERALAKSQKKGS